MERRGRLESVSVAWSKLAAEGQCVVLFEQSGVRVEPGATCMDGIAELVSGMGVVLEAMGKGSVGSRALSSGDKGGEEDLQRDCERGMSRNGTEEYHGSQRKINPQEGEMSE